MSDTPDNDSMLPPKLNLSKKIAPKAKPAPIPGAGAPADIPDTSRINLTAKPIAKPLGKATAKPVAKPVVKLTPPDATTAKPKPTTILKAKPAGTVRLKPIAKPAVKISDPVTAPTVETKPTIAPSEKAKPLTAKPLTAKPLATKPTIAAKNKPTPLATKPKLTATIKPKTISAQPITPKPEVTEEKAAPAKPTLKAKPLKPKTVSLKPKPAVGIKRDGIDPNAPAGSKRATSKIPLTLSSKPKAGEQLNTKTIKIKPSADINHLTGKITVPENPTIDAKVPDPKRQTSRISLDSALGNDSEQTGPKTIRLKRPGTTPTVNVNAKPNGDGELSKTAKIELPKDNNIPDTQKKTIKIKRPSQKRTAKKVAVKRNDTTAAAAPTDDAPVDEDAPTLVNLHPLAPVASDSVHWTFIVSSIAAMIVACVLIYVLCAQVFGPNISLTKLAYAGTDVELPWPGRIL